MSLGNEYYYVISFSDETKGLYFGLLEQFFPVTKNSIKLKLQTL